VARPRRTIAMIHAGLEYPLPEEKRCGMCLQWLPRDRFAKSARGDGRQRRCRDCQRLSHCEWQRRTRQAARETARYRTDPEHAKRVRARQRMGRRVQRGTLPRQPCERCGAPEAQTHHPDYDKPTEIRWLCPKCHGAEHYPQAQVEPAARRDAAAEGLARLAEKYANR
jgi:ribosomal protein S27AE